MSTVVLCEYEWEHGLHGCGLDEGHPGDHVCTPPDCDATSPNITIAPDALAGVERIISVPGWIAEGDRTMSGEACLRLRQGPRGRGQRRETYLIVADTAENCHRALEAAKVQIEQRRG
jgi:hypothetical protein